MTTKTYARLSANALADGLLLDPALLQVTTGVTYAGGRTVLGDVPQFSGESSYELYFWSTLRNSLAGLASYGIAQANVDLTKHVGLDTASRGWGFRPAEGQIWNNNANVSGTSVAPVEERKLLGLHVKLAPALCTCDWTVDGNVVYTAVLPNGFGWLPAISLGSAVVGDISAIINTGLNRGDQTTFKQGWWTQAPGLASLYLALATEAFMSATIDTPASQPYSPLILNGVGISIKRLPQPWFHRGSGRTNPAALTAFRFNNSKGDFNALVGADVKDSPITLAVIDAPAGGAGLLSSSTPMLTGILDAVSAPDVSTVNATVRDALARFDIPCPVRIIPPFYDQSAAGKIQPIGIGAQRIIRPILLDAPNRIFLLGDAPMSNVAVVSDNAAPLDKVSSPPQVQPALRGAGFQLATLNVGRLAADISSVGAQWVPNGAVDVLAGIGAFTTWAGSPSQPTGWLKSVVAGVSTFGSIAQTSSYGTSSALAITSFVPYTLNVGGSYYGYPVNSTANVFLPGRTYRVTFKLLSTQGYGVQSKYGLAIMSKLSNSARYWITPFLDPLTQPLGTSSTYTFEYTHPITEPASPMYLVAIAAMNSPFSTPASVTTPCGVVLDDLTVELVAQFQVAPLQGISLKDAFTEVLVNRCGESPSVFNAADCDAIDAATAYTSSDGTIRRITIGLRYEDQPNVLDMLTTIADQFGAVIFTDATGQIRVRRLTGNNDGSPIVAAFSKANIDSDSFTSLPDTAPGLTTLYGARHNCEPFGATDFVTDTDAVPAGIRAQYQGTSQFNVTATTPLSQEYAAARGAGRLHTLIDEREAVVSEGNRVAGLFSEKHLFRQFVARYDGLSLGIGPAVAPQQLYYNDKIAVTLPEFGWVGERMTVVGTELFPGGNYILITVRH